MKKILLTGALACFGALSANAAVTITWNAPYNGGMSSNLANTAGTVSNGLFYGLLAFGADGSYQSLYLEPISLSPGKTIPLTGTDDVIVVANDLTGDSSQDGALLEGDNSTPGGNGGITGLSFSLGNGIAPGQKYGIIWFDQTTNRAGLLTDASFVIPADGQIVAHDQPWVGVDPIRSANQIQFPPVPEISSSMLGLLGVFGFIRRRR